ncbi:MAG: hypothetical protein EOO06_02725 [Chitinophagaceae bacterium]|nr:MAG: hypothetical protein EOO06_02725 [Chitinophagaceae bacterium]
MKKILVAVLTLLAFNATAQLNNSWIDYSKTYYKFPISSDGLVKIPQSSLPAALQGVNADHFQLWRNGEQVRIFTSVTGAPLGAAGFIEFFGKRNDGLPDKQLYRNADFQLNERYSLETDTAIYFLTTSTNTAANLRFTSLVNTAPSAATPDAYYINSIDTFFRNRQNRGYAANVQQYVYSSSYDKGEGWTSGDIGTGANFNFQLPGLNAYSGGPVSTYSIRVNAGGNADLNRNLVVKINNAEVFNEAMPDFDYKKVIVSNLPLSGLVNPNNNVLFSINGNTNAAPNDRIIVASAGISYPAIFNFNNRKVWHFELAASATGNYLNIVNFNTGGVQPILYDLTSGTRYLGEIASTAGRVKFVLPPSSTARKFILVSNEASNATVITAVSAPKTFQNLSIASNQSNYIIISNPLLYNDGNGHNYVEDYRSYRSSANGGGFNAKVYDIDELTDQFAFGIKGHPGSVRDFVRYAHAQFATTPQYVFIIGRGVNYVDEWSFGASPLLKRQSLVPTFGWPASDVLLVSNPATALPLVPIGRVAAVSPIEVNNYLQKVIQYEQAQRSQSPYIGDKAWMKDFIHVIGGKDSSESQAFKFYMDGYKRIAEDTLMGAQVETFSKTSTGVVQQASSDRILQLMTQGLGFIGYFGHSSANTFEFNLSSPDQYNNQGKYPFFNVSGCSAGNFYIYDPLRLSGNLSISEKYILSNQRGSIGFLADTHFGIPPFLNYYNDNFYTLFSKSMYGGTVGNQINEVLRLMGGGSTTLDFFNRIHMEEIALHGDPAIKINHFAKPDYAIEEASVKVSPTIISVADNNFNVKVKMNNIGKATGDSIWVYVKRKLPNDSIRVLFDQKIPGIRNTDSLEFTVPIAPTTDKGLNQLIVELDYKFGVDELFETNNKITKDFYIFEDELRPTYPYNFSIVNQQNLTYVANTANPLGANRQYVMEIDTTVLFNSALKKVYNTSGIGGIVQFTPTNITFTDSTVYYWRVSMVPVDNTPVIWNGFSFVYLPNSTSGFNQSHFYQHKQSVYDNIELKDDRKFHYPIVPRNLIIRTGLYPAFNYDKININLDFNRMEQYGCVYNSLQVYVFDTTTLKPWNNWKFPVSPGVFSGYYGSAPTCPDIPGDTLTRRAFFEFPHANPGGVPYRKRMMDMLDAIPNGMYVAITNLGRYDNNTTFIDQWRADEALYGPGNSLYHKLKNIGFTTIDSFTRNLPFMYFYKKGSTSFTPRQVMGEKDTSYIEEFITLNTIKPEGSIESPAYGPAREWKELHWRGSTTDPLPVGDTVKVEVWGIRNNGTASLLATVAPATDTSLSFINAQVYPYVKLKMQNKDERYITPAHLRYWRINAVLAPEGAVAPNILYQMSADTVDQGQNIEFALAFKNISPMPFDSLLKVKFTITDRNNVPHVIDLPKRKALVSGDTIIAKYTIDTRNYPGHNTLLVDFNPDFDQPEQLHYNNVLYKDFFVRADNYNPLLDVTFDGVHILNNDIVSSKPNILVKLKDESRFLALADTALLKVQVRFPDQSLHEYHFNDSMIFTPANLSTGENTASIELRPYFPEDGEYELIVSGKDVNGNKAGDLDYHVSFTVINKPMISNLLNYPNPFTTSTAFVFTVTGSQPPQNMRIQILTITGKVVREITRDELGPIHVGRNITEFKWDGTDMYGQKLANGVYIYRVLTNLNGKSLEKYRADGDNTDKYFNKGYGKMYLMR